MRYYAAITTKYGVMQSKYYEDYNSKSGIYLNKE